MASLYQRSSGTYYAQFHEPGRGRKRIPLKTKDKATERALLARVERLYLTGEANPWDDDMHAAVQPKRSGAERSRSALFSSTSWTAAER